MPLSRKRKSKGNKTKKKKNNDGIQRRVIDGIEFIQDGIMTQINNRRSKKEHEQYLQDVKDGNPNLEQSIVQLTDGISEIFKTYDSLYLLGALGVRNLKLDNDRVDDGMSEIILEMAQSLAMANPEVADKPKPSPEILPRLMDMLIDRQNRLRAYYSNESTIYLTDHPEANKQTTDLRLNVILERLSIRGVGYYQHVEKIFLELFGQYDEFLKEKHGFTAKEMTETLLSLEASVAYRFEKRDEPMPKVGILFMNWTMENQIFPPIPNPENVERFKLAHPEVTVENGKLVTYQPKNISTLPQIFEMKPLSDIQKSVLEAMSLSFGENQDYLTGEHPGEGLNESLISLKPFIKSEDGNYYGFNLSIASRNFLRIGQYLIKSADEKYYNSHYLGNKYFISRDNFLERKVAEIFSKFLTDVDFKLNMHYPIPGDEKMTTEIDLLGIGNEETYLIEIKAGELNEDARKGGIGNLLSRLRKNVGEGANQSERALTHIRQGSGIFKDSKGIEVSVNPQHKIYKIIVTLDTFSGVLTKISMLERTQVFKKSDEFPWIVNIYDLMIFGDILETKTDFNEFLDKRLALNEWGAFVSHDELYMLGHFLENDLIFNNNSKKFDHFTLGNHNQDIDNYYYAQQMGMKVEKPKRKKQ